jgi:hypothetical protein
LNNSDKEDIRKLIVDEFNVDELAIDESTGEITEFMPITKEE